MKRGGALNINLHEVEILAPADAIPEEIVVDLTGLEIGDAIRAADLVLPEPACELTAAPPRATVASIADLVAPWPATKPPRRGGSPPPPRSRRAPPERRPC